MPRRPLLPPTRASLPSRPLLPPPPRRQDPAARKALVAELHLLKTDLFMELVDGGAMPLRPGVARLVGGWVGGLGVAVGGLGVAVGGLGG